MDNYRDLIFTELKLFRYILKKAIHAASTFPAKANAILSAVDNIITDMDGVLEEESQS